MNSFLLMNYVIESQGVFTISSDQFFLRFWKLVLKNIPCVIFVAPNVVYNRYCIDSNTNTNTHAWEIEYLLFFVTYSKLKRSIYCWIEKPLFLVTFGIDSQKREMLKVKGVWKSLISIRDFCTSKTNLFHFHFLFSLSLWFPLYLYSFFVSETIFLAIRHLQFPFGFVFLLPLFKYYFPTILTNCVCNFNASIVYLAIGNEIFNRFPFCR